MIELLPHNQNITFKEDTHQYFTQSGEELTSVSRILELYKPKFDPTGIIAYKCAQREGITKQEIQARWKKTNDDANVKGHNFHRQAEHFIKTGEILDEDYKDVVKQLADIKFKGKLTSEVRLADTQRYKICGTTDFLEEFKNKIVSVRDFKTNKRFEYKSKYRTKMLPPFEKYEVCEYNNYSFQIGIYSYILELNGYKTKEREVYYIQPETRILETIKIPDMRDEVIKMLEHYRKMQEW